MSSKKFFELFERDPYLALNYILVVCPRDSYGHNKFHLGFISDDDALRIVRVLKNGVNGGLSSTDFRVDFTASSLGNSLYMLDPDNGDDRLLFTWDTK